MRSKILFTSILASLSALLLALHTTSASAQNAYPDQAYRNCRTWCEVRIEASEVSAQPEPWLKGPANRTMYEPTLWIRLRVRNTTDQPQKLDIFDIKRLIIWGTDGPDQFSGRPAASSGFYPATGVVGTGTSATTLTIPPHGDVVFRQQFTNMSGAIKGLYLMFGKDFVVGAAPWDAAPMLPDYVELERNLHYQGTLDYIPTHVPPPQRAAELVGKWTSGDLPVTVTQSGNKLVVTLPNTNPSKFEFGITGNPNLMIGISPRYSPGDETVDKVNLYISEDGKTITAQSDSRKVSWQATRETDSPQQPGPQAPQDPVPQQPQESQQPVPQQPQQPQQPVPQQPQQPSQPRPVPQEPQPQPEPPEDDFQPLGIWDVRVDKVENPREDRLTHVYVTLRNASTQPQLQTGDVWVYLEDTSGATQRTGQGVRAIPGPPQLFGSPPPITLPGKTIKAKYIFDRVKGASISKITVVEGDQQAEYEF